MTKGKKRTTVAAAKAAAPAAPTTPAKQAKKQADKKPATKPEKDDRLTPAQLGHHVTPTGDRRKRFRDKD